MAGYGYEYCTPDGNGTVQHESIILVFIRVIFQAGAEQAGSPVVLSRHVRPPRAELNRQHHSVISRRASQSVNPSNHQGVETP